MSSQVIQAVAEAARRTEEASAIREMEVQEARKEKEQLVAAYTAEIRKIHEMQFLEAEKLRQELAAASKARDSLQQQCSSLELVIVELKASQEKANQAHLAELAGLQRARDENVVALVSEGQRLLEQNLHCHREALCNEAFHSGKHLIAEEICERFSAAIQATADRGAISIKRLRMAVWERDRTISKLQAQLLDAGQAATKMAESHKMQLDLVTRKVEVAAKANREEMHKSAKAEKRLGEVVEESNKKDQAYLTEKLRMDGLLHSATESNAELKKSNENLQNQLNESKDAQTALIIERQQLQSQMADLEGRFKALGEESTTRIQELMRDRESLIAESARIKDLHRVEAQALRKELHEAVSAHQKETTTNEIAKTELERAFSEKESGLLQRISTLEDHAHTLVSANREVVELDSKLRAELAQKEAEVKACRSQMQTLREDRDRANQGFAAMSQEQHALQGKLIEQQQHLATRERELADAKSLWQLTTEQTKRLEDDLQHVHADRQQLEAKLTDSTKDLENKDRELMEKTEALKVCATQQQLVSSAQEMAKRLSLKTQEAADLCAENKALREALLVSEANYATTHTRLNHSLQEGATTSVILEKSLAKIQKEAIVERDAADLKVVLLRASNALRSALEGQGHSIATLPLAPSSSLELPYLEQVLLDHVTLCTQHMQGGGVLNKSGATAAVPSAVRTPMVYCARAE